MHQRIRADLEARILSGAWPPGHRIPFEHELMVRYGCSRMTVSKALGELSRAGFIERRRRAGSFVSRPQAQSAVLAIPDLRAEVTARGERYDYRLLSARRRIATCADREALGLSARAEVLALRCLHLAAGQPLALEQRLLNLGAVPDAAGIDFTAIAPGAWLLEHVPWTEAENRITAEPADARTAARLHLAPGAPCLVVERRTWRADETITRVRQLFAGERYHLVARFAGAADPERIPRT